MSTALVTRPAGDMLPDPQTWTTLLQMADAYLKSGFLPAHIKTPQAAVYIIMKGKELGIPATYALSNIIVIQGKPTANAELMLALIYRDHGDDAMKPGESTVERCTFSYKRRAWKDRQSYTFSMADAKQAGLTGGNWAKYPAAMLRARCISAIARMAFPDSIGGLYTSEELGAAVTVTEEGAVEVLDAPIVVSNGHAVDTSTGEVVTPAARYAAYAALHESIFAKTGIEAEVEQPENLEEIEAAIARLEEQYEGWVTKKDATDPPALTPDQRAKILKLCEQTGHPLPTVKLSVTGAMRLINQLILLPPKAAVPAPETPDPVAVPL